jgi:hypothetical protein
MLDQLGGRFADAKVPVECDVVVEKTKTDVCEVGVCVCVLVEPACLLLNALLNTPLSAAA